MRKVLKIMKLMPISVMIVVVLLLGFQSTSHALTLSFYDFVNPVFFVEDGSAKDSSPLAGVVTFNGTIGDWIVNVTTGVSKPVLGSAASPEIDLNSLNVTSSSGGHLQFGMVDSGFTGPTAGTFILAVGGTTQGSVSFSAFKDESNSETFGGSTFATSGPFSTASWNATTSGPFNAATAPFSLGLMAEITHAGKAATSFDGNLQVVPIPPTAILLGSGLLGLVGLGWRRARKEG